MTSSFSIFLCLFSLFSYAKGDEPSFDTPHVVPTTREENENEEETLQGYALAASFSPQLKYHTQSQQDAYYLYRLHADAYHHLIAFSDNGDLVQLYDSSKWFVHPSQRYVVLQWVQSDELFIKPSASCFSPYRYVLYNRTIQQAVEVNLAAAPLFMGARTLTIINIDPYQRLIQLNDNTVWTLDMTGASFAYWNIGQRVLVGVNNNWHHAAYPQILINVDIYGEPYRLTEFYGYGVNY